MLEEILFIFPFFQYLLKYAVYLAKISPFVIFCVIFVFFIFPESNIENSFLLPFIYYLIRWKKNYLLVLVIPFFQFLPKYHFSFPFQNLLIILSHPWQKNVFYLIFYRCYFTITLYKFQ